MAGKPPRGALATLAALPGITLEQRRNVLEELDQRWCAHAFNSMQRANESTAAGKSFDARNWTWAAGVATDKVFAIREIPTQVIANVHEYRVNLPAVMDKLAAASHVLDTHQRRVVKQLAKPVVGRVINSPTSSVETDAESC